MFYSSKKFFNSLLDFARNHGNVKPFDTDLLQGEEFVFNLCYSHPHADNYC